MVSNLNIKSFLERSRALEEIQRDCAAAEEGGKVDLKHTAGKLQFLVKAINDDMVAINQGARVSPEVDQAYWKHRHELDVTSARVKQAEQKSGSNNIFTSITSSRWAKPIAYTALAVTAFGTAYLAYSDWSSGSGTGHRGGSRSNINNAENLLGKSSSAMSPIGEGTGTNNGRGSSKARNLFWLFMGWATVKNDASSLLGDKCLPHICVGTPCLPDNSTEHMEEDKNRKSEEKVEIDDNRGVTISDPKKDREEQQLRSPPPPLRQKWIGSAIISPKK